MISNQVVKYIGYLTKFGFYIKSLPFEFELGYLKLWPHSKKFQCIDALSWIGEVSIISLLTYDLLCHQIPASNVIFNLFGICFLMLFVGGHLVVVLLDTKFVGVVNSVLVLNSRLGKNFDIFNNKIYYSTAYFQVVLSIFG